VLRVRYGRHSFLLCGDVERAAERRMLADNQVSRADVLKVAHHGSKTSSTEEFLDAVRPSFAVISVGPDNSYGHPNREALDRLAAHRAVLFRTDQDGLISIRTDGYRLLLETNRWRAANSLLLGLF
jgi:competence protein ComEC